MFAALTLDATRRLEVTAARSSRAWLGLEDGVRA